MYRRKNSIRVAPVALALLCLLIVVVETRAQEKADLLWISPDRSAATEKIEHALDSDTTLEFIETPLQDVVAYLEDLHGIQIELDNRALDNVGVGGDVPITRNLKSISLRSALRLLLRDLDLTYIIADEVLQITAREAAEQRGIVRVYVVAELLGDSQSADDLAIVLSDMVRQSPQGGAKRRDLLDPPVQSPQQITPYGKLLVVRDTTEGHEHLVALLRAMQQGIDATKPANGVETTILPLPSRDPKPPTNEVPPAPTEGE